jgi:hypothetical protein
VDLLAVGRPIESEDQLLENAGILSGHGHPPVWLVNERKPGRLPGAPSPAGTAGDATS